MSEISAAGMSGAMGSVSIRTPSTPTPSQTPATPTDGGGARTTAAATSLETGRTDSSSSMTERLSLSSSSMSLSVEQTAANDKLAMLVMLLVQLLFGQKDKAKEEKDPFVGLAAMMLLSSLSGGAERMSYIESNTSQVAYASTTSNVSAVQASAYGQGAAPSLDGTTGLGGNLDIQG